MVDLLISGPEGKIEAKYTHNNNDQSPIVLILHPDPSRGGSMNTKIVFKLYKFVFHVAIEIKLACHGVANAINYTRRQLRGITVHCRAAD